MRILSMGWLFSAVAAVSVASGAAPAQLARTPAEARERLSNLVDVDLDPMPVGELGQRLEQLTGIMVIVDPRAARAADPETIPIFLRAHRARLADALDWALRSIGWYWSLKGATLYVSSEAAPAGCFSTRVYDVRDLADRGSDARYPRYDVDQFAGLIPETNPLSWTPASATWTSTGGRGNLRPINRGGRTVLVVYQTDTEHRRFEELLSKLRATGQRAPNPERAAPASRPAALQVPQADAPRWWAALEEIARKQLCSWQFPQLWPPLTPPVMSICDGTFAIVPPQDARVHLLAWYVAADEDLPLVKIRALVCGYSSTTKIWQLATYTWHPLNLRALAEADWTNDVPAFAFSWFPSTYVRRPRDRDILRFLGGLGDPWQFSDRPLSRLQAGNVRPDEWRKVTGEDPTQFYSPALPRSYQLPRAVEIAQREHRIMSRRDKRVRKKQSGVWLSIDVLKMGIRQYEEAMPRRPVEPVTLESVTPGYQDR